MQINTVRREESRRELNAVLTAAEDWLTDLKNRDKNPDGTYRGQHESQRRTLDALLLGAGEKIVERLENLKADAMEPLAFHDECRTVDGASVWLRRLDEYFRLRLDQHRDPRWAALLGGADEAVWSIWRQPFVVNKVENNQAVAGTRRDPGPTPLTGIEPEWSPSALPSGRPLAGKLIADGELPQLTAYLQRMPLPILYLPPWCAASPWWLVFVAHEVGHHLQFHLGLVDPFDKLIRQTVRSTVEGNGFGGKVEDAEKWAGWGKEIFADMVSVAALGIWAVRALARVETARPERMVEPRNGYPPRAIRILLAARAATQLSGGSATVEKVLAGTGAEGVETVIAGNAVTARYSHYIDPVLEAALQTRLSDETAPLARLFNSTLDPLLFDPTPAAGRAGAQIATLANALSSNAPISAALFPNRLETARYIMAASFFAWEHIGLQGGEGTEGETTRNKARETLRTNTCAALAAASPPGLRAARSKSTNDAKEEAALPQDFADFLLDFSAKSRGAAAENAENEPK